MDVLVVLPTYNESENIDHVLRRIRASLPAATVLVVDDGSPDGTADLAEIVGKELGSVEVMRRAGKSGLGSAYRAGFAWGLDRGFDACIEMDAALSHEPEALPALVAPLSEGMELVIGSRYIPGGVIPNWAWHRRLLSRGGNLYASALLGLGVADATAGRPGRDSAGACPRRRRRGHAPALSRQGHQEWATWDERRREPNSRWTPHRVTRPKASTTMKADIFDSPSTRPTNRIGTSRIGAPARLAA